jgi:ketosteroid isomerase-like protein
MTYMKAYPTITKFTVTKDDIAGNGDVAYVRGPYSIDVTMPDSSHGHA